MERMSSALDSDTNPMGTLLDQYLDTYRHSRGDIVEGVIASVNPRSILIDIGGKSDAVVHSREVERMTNQELQALQPGQDVSVYVVDNDRDGTMIVSLARAAQQTDWEEARQLMENHETVDLTIVDTNKGGVIVRWGELRGFVPGSQLMPNWRRFQDPSNPDRRWQALMGKTLKLTVIEVTPERNRLILSERNAYQQRATKRKILESLEVGSVETGIVSNIVPFGAFVNVKGVDGLLHVSELSWRRVDDPQEVVREGQSIEVYVLDIELEKERLGLSLKRLRPDPWEQLEEICQVGALAEVKVVNLTAFGAFAALVEKPELEGLIHISELSDENVGHPEEVVTAGETYTVRIISVRPKQRRIAFSLKSVEQVPSDAN